MCVALGSSSSEEEHDSALQGITLTSCREEGLVEAERQPRSSSNCAIQRLIGYDDSRGSSPYLEQTVFGFKSEPTRAPDTLREM